MIILVLTVIFVVLAARYDTEPERHERGLREAEAQHRRDVYGAP